MRVIGVDLARSGGGGRPAFALVRYESVADLYIVEGLLVIDVKRGEPANYNEIQDDIALTAKKFHVDKIVFDPWQAYSMMDFLNEPKRSGLRGEIAEGHDFTKHSRPKLFERFINVVQQRKLRASPHEILKQELIGLEVKQTLSGEYRIDHQKSGGSDDAISAIALALHRLPEYRAGDFFPEAFGSRDTAGLVQGAGWTTSAPSPSQEQGPSVWRGGPSGGGIDWDNVRW